MESTSGVPDLVPYPFAALTRRVFRELEQSDAIFDLPRKKFFLGDPELDLSVSLHGLRASSPLGPAAGPQTQMAQNIVLSWLGGCRIMELKTVQINDELEIPRPCIDVHTVGLNAEWSQELKLEESLDEYVKGAMLVEMLRAGPLAPIEGFGDTIYDISVGYDLEGIRTERVQSFIRGMLDASGVVDRLRREIPSEHRELRDLDYPTRLSNTVTLSTFHGCPPHEIEQIMEFLLRECRLHSIVKFNPMLLGPTRARYLLHDVLGYRDITVPDSAFERDTTWQQAVDFVGRLGETAAEVGLGFGAKFSNTLIVKNDRGFLAPDEAEVYLSGEPLHILAIHLVREFRKTFGDAFPISFAAGVDRQNFPDAVALGLVPITVCTDLLRKGGYGRLITYYAELRRRMDAVSAASIDDFVIVAYGQGLAALDRLGLDRDDPVYRRAKDALFEGGDLRAAAGEHYERWVSEARILNTDHYVEEATADPRYSREKNAKGPRKIGRHLQLFDCLTCDICVPVCPNDANFTLGSDQREIEVVQVARAADGWRWQRQKPLVLEERHQIANFADFCNECGNCDIFCPEDGGPYIMKPRFFGRVENWRRATHLDGFYLERTGDGDQVLGRFDGRDYAMTVAGDRVAYTGDGFALEFDLSDPEGTVSGEGEGEIDLTYCFIMDYVRRAIFDTAAPNYINSQFSGS